MFEIDGEMPLIEKNILIVEDDLDIHIMMKESLTEAGYWVRHTSNVNSAISILKETNINLILLDLFLEGSRGEDVIKFVRRQDPLTPIIVLSNAKEINLKINAINIGADDFLMKPFNMQELLIRVKRSLIRTHHNKYFSLALKNQIEYGSLKLNYEKTSLIIGNKAICLKGKLFEITEFFMKYPNELITKNELQHKLWPGEFISESSLYVYIHKLRKILKRNCEGTADLQLIYGKGYLFSIYEK